MLKNIKMKIDSSLEYLMENELKKITYELEKLNQNYEYFNNKIDNYYFYKNLLLILITIMLYIFLIFFPTFFNKFLEKL